jgi:hypothetical protein
MYDDPYAILWSVIILALFAFCCAKIARRLGYDRPWVIGLLMLVPLVNLLVFLVLAFDKSPNEKRLAELATRSQSHGGSEASRSDDASSVA